MAHAERVMEKLTAFMELEIAAYPAQCRNLKFASPLVQGQFQTALRADYCGDLGKPRLTLLKMYGKRKNTHWILN
jgi:hypothetical protein